MYDKQISFVHNKVVYFLPIVSLLFVVAANTTAVKMCKNGTKSLSEQGL